MALWGYINSPFLIKFSPTSFSMRCFVPESVITIVVARWRILKISWFLLHSSYGISLKGKGFFSCFFFFFLNLWNTSAWTPGFLFYSFFIYFDARIIPEPFQSWLLCPFFFFLQLPHHSSITYLSYFLAQDFSCSSCTFSALVLESTILSGKSGSFY